VITRDLSTMIAVASGNKAQVTRWEDCLERARIEFVVAEPLDPTTDAGFRAEIWVAREDPKRPARYCAIPASGGPDSVVSGASCRDWFFNPPALRIL
jgi:hypothetical protein